MNKTGDLRKRNPDIIYKDFVIHNSELKPIKAKKSTTYTSAIVESADDYYMAVARFSISHLTIPLYFFDADISTKYTVSVRSGGVVKAPVALNYISSGTYSDIGYTRPVFYYEQFVEMMNVALRTVTTVTVPTVTDPNRIFMGYSANDGKFSFYYTANTRLTFSHIVLSELLYNQLGYFKAERQADGSYWIPLTELHGELNTYVSPVSLVEYLYLQQERSALYLLNQIQNIEFITNNIPAVKEFIPNFTDGKGDVLSSQSVLADFIPNLGSGRELSEYQYYPQGPLRLIDLSNDRPIKTIDIQMRYVTKTGERYELYLLRDESITIKLVFLKKSLANNSYSSLLTDKIGEGY